MNIKYYPFISIFHHTYLYANSKNPLPMTLFTHLTVILASVSLAPSGFAFVHTYHINRSVFRHVSLSYQPPSLSINVNMSARNNRIWRLSNNLDDDSKQLDLIRKRDRFLRQPFIKAVDKFKARPGTYLMIPCIAALVGWYVVSYFFP